MNKELLSPVALTAEQAAKYVGGRNAAQFRREVKAGIWPAPITATSRPRRWSRMQIDERLRGVEKTDTIDPDVAALNKRFGVSK